jgi:hypothetical protein
MKVPAIHAALWLQLPREETAAVAIASNPRCDGVAWHIAARRRRIPQCQLGTATIGHRPKGHVAQHGLVPPWSCCCGHDGSRHQSRRRPSRRYNRTMAALSRDTHGVVWRVPRGGGGNMNLATATAHTVRQALVRRSTVAQCVAVYWMIQGGRSSIDSVRFWRRNGDLQLSTTQHRLAAWAGGVIGYVSIYIRVQRYCFGGLIWRDD